MNSLVRFLQAALAVGWLFVFGQAQAGELEAAKSINQFGIDLYGKIAHGDNNLCISPYSIDSALAMAFDGATGETRSEMSRVLHLDPAGDPNKSFAALQKSLEALGRQTAEIAAAAKERGGPSEPITIAVANRLFVQAGYQFREKFFTEIKVAFGAEPEVLNFKKEPVAATERINQWVAEQTRKRIQNLIPSPLATSTRLVLTNALYLKAPWASEFTSQLTKPEPFHLAGGGRAEVPTMQKRESLRYAKRDGFSIVALPYSGGDLQFVVLLPDEVDRLAGVEKKLSAELLASCTKLESTDVVLYLPKFNLQPPTLPLGRELQSLGMQSAFDIPMGSANFDRIAPRRPDDYLAISEVFHKTFIEVDEHGTEAAAATAVAMMATSALGSPPPPPVEVRVDRPFLYAIQHVPSGACLFLGRVTDPRAGAR